MTAKQLVKDFYKSDALIDPVVMADYLHPDLTLEWRSSTGPIMLDRQKVLDLTAEMSKAYIRSKAKIGHIIREGDLVSVRYSHFVKTIENPREEMLLAHFFVIWEIKDGKLYHGFQMSQPS